MSAESGMMNFLLETVASATVSTLLVLVGAWLARVFIQERLKGSVQHEFNERLEAVKADFKIREAILQAQLQGNNQQLQLLQSGVLSARASRQTALDARRLDAIDALWASFHQLAPLRNAANLMKVIKYEAALAQAAIDPQLRSSFQELAKFAGVSTEQLKLAETHLPWKARLYVTDRTWKLFEVYQSVLYIQLLRLKQLESGVSKDFTKIKEAISEVKAALPHQSGFLDEHGDDVLPMLVDELGLAFERELLSMLRDEPRSADDLQQVGLLMAAAGKIMDSVPASSSLA